MAKKINKNSLKNLEKKTPFTKDNQPSPEAKSKGMVEKRKEENLLFTLRTQMHEYGIIQKVVKGIDQEIENGKLENAIKLVNIAKENEKQDLEITSKGFNITVADEKHKEMLEDL